LILQGSIAKRLGDFPQAEAALLDAIQKAKEIEFLYSEGLAEMNRGTLYHDRGEFKKAQEAYLRAFAIAKKFPHPLLELTLQHNWVNLLYYTGRSAEAEAACFDWLKQSLRYQDVSQQAVALNFLALLAGQKGLKEKKLDYLNQAIGLLNPRLLPNSWPRP
jgi:tetratricopeptide (TPR) repeat protein